MDDNTRRVERNEEVVVSGEPDSTVVNQTHTTTAAGSGAMQPGVPVANQTTVATTTSAAPPQDRVVAHNVAERVVDPAADKAAAVDWVGRLVWFLVGLFSVLLAIRFVLLMTGANEAAGFSQLIYGLTGWLVAPFAGLFGRPITYPGSAGTAVLEFESLVAIVVLVLIGWLITKLAQLMLGTNRTTGTVVSETERNTRL